MLLLCFVGVCNFCGQKKRELQRFDSVSVFLVKRGTAKFHGSKRSQDPVYKLMRTTARIEERISFLEELFGNYVGIMWLWCKMELFSILVDQK